MSLSSESTGMVMPVQPAYQNCGSGFGWGNGDFGSWIILFLLFGLFGGWGNGFGGWGGSGFQGYATRADINDGFALNNLQGGQRDILGAVTDGFHGVDNAVCTLGYQTQQGFNNLASQLASCCCDTREAIQGVRYDLATQSCDTRNTIQNTTRDIIDNANANSRAILDFLTQDKIATLQAENQSLKLAASQSAQNATLMAAMDANTAELLRRTGHDCPTAAYVVQPPSPVTFPNFSNCNCGSCGC